VFVVWSHREDTSEKNRDASRHHLRFIAEIRDLSSVR